MDKNNARKRLLIYPNFQLRLIVGLFVSHLVLISVFFITQTVFFNTYKKLGQQMGLPADHMFFGFVDQQRHKMILFLLVASALVMILGAVYSLVVSHRVAGPCGGPRGGHEDPGGSQGGSAGGRDCRTCEYRRTVTTNFREGRGEHRALTWSLTPPSG